MLIRSTLPVAVAVADSRFPARRAGQMISRGDVRVVSGVGDKGTSWMTISGGEGLGLDGAQRLAELLRQAPPPMLEAIDLRCAPPWGPTPSVSYCSPLPFLRSIRQLGAGVQLQLTYHTSIPSVILLWTFCLNT